MTDQITLRPPKPFDVTLTPPGSKSLTNRALLIAALARGRSTISGWLDADDTRHMRACLDQLGIDVQTTDDGALALEGAAGPLVPPPGTEPTLYVGTAGTVARFLLPAVAAGSGVASMDGTARMRERPMNQVIDGLRELGAVLECRGDEGFLPVRIGPNEAGLRGGELRLTRPASSQFVSGLVIAGCLSREPLELILEQGTPARPYVDMTLAVLERFGGRAGWTKTNTLVVEPKPLQATDYLVEPDASAASYLLALAAIYRGRTTIPHLGHASLQGDVRFAELLARMGAIVEQTADRTTVQGTDVLRGGDFDLSDMPDMTLTLAVTALFAEGTTRIRGVEILRHHESDRLAAAASELRKFGAAVQEDTGSLTIEPPANRVQNPRIETYDDHRMAMAFALAGSVTILDPKCVGKTYPDYFKDLANLGMVELPK